MSLTYPRCSGSLRARTYPAFSSPQDFLIMFLHHVAAISLITFSYVNNMARVGTLVMCLHDAADVLIEVREDDLGIWVERWSSGFHPLPQPSAQPSLYICGLIETLLQSLLCCQMSHRQLLTSSCDLFFFLPRLPRWPITPNVRYCATCCLRCLQFSS